MKLFEAALARNTHAKVAYGAPGQGEAAIYNGAGEKAIQP
jgi:hypothetical protein